MTSLQGQFVDSLRESGEQADKLVAEVISEPAKSFASERQGLEQQWSSGGRVATQACASPSSATARSSTAC